MIAALAEPSFENRRIDADLTGGAGPASQHLHLDLTVAGAKPPIGAAFKNSEADAAKPRRRGPRRVGTERRSETLVGALVAIDRCDHRRIVTGLRPQRDDAVVTQRRIKRARKAHQRRYQAIEPGG